jgi:5'-methylthioadenosine phosphorylase
VIGVFGRSGFYEFLEDVEELRVDAPFGAPSAAIRARSAGPS